MQMLASLYIRNSVENYFGRQVSRRMECTALTQCVIVNYSGSIAYQTQTGSISN